jgi:hypothetical protein
MTDEASISNGTLTRATFATRIAWITALVALISSAPALAAPPQATKATEKKNADRLFELHLADAASYEIFRDTAHQQTLELRRQPVYLWSNPTRNMGQTGAVFVWTWQGRPEVVASIFSHPEKGKRMVVHELVSLSTEVLEPRRESENTWQPRAGVVMQPLPGAPAPADSSKQRQFQMRAFSRDFSGHSLDYEKQTWELRRLPTPLIQYASPELGILDGALFAYVTSAGTDPEVLVLLEARETRSGPQWRFAVARFSDLDLWVNYKDTEVWTSIRSSENTTFNDPQHRYRLYRDRFIDDMIEVDP